MRIRNSQPSFPPPSICPEAMVAPNNPRAQRCSYFDRRFLVEEANRHIGWSYASLRKPSSPDKSEAQLHDGMLPAVASERNSVNYVEQGAQRVGESANEGRKSRLSRTYNRKGDNSKFSTNIVLGLSAPSCQSGFVGRRWARTGDRKKVGERVHPVKIRRRRQQMECEGKDQKDAIEEGMGGGQKILSEEEDISARDEFQSNSIDCLFNCESSFLPDNPQQQEKVEKLCLQEISVEYALRVKRKRGRPRKGMGWQPMASGRG